MREHFEIPVLALASASVILPLVVASSATVPALTPKVFFFQTIVLFLGGAYSLLLLFDWQRYRPRLTPLTAALLFWAGALLISTLFGIDWHRSLWSTNMRMTGVVFIAHLIVFYGILSAVIRQENHWRWIFRLFLAVGIAVVLLGLALQADQDRISSTLGNSTFLGSFTIFLIFLSALAALREKQQGWLFFAGCAGVAGLIGLFASGTRGALVGLGAGVIVSVCWYIIAACKSRKQKAALAGFLGGAILILFAVFFLGGPFQRENATATAHTRFLAWQAAVAAWQDRPLLGWGPGNFAYAFNAHYPAEILQYGLEETWFDIAHGVPFDTLATQGIVGLAAYLSIFGAAAFVLYKGGRRGIFDAPTASIGVGLLAAYFVQNAFLFDTPTSYVSFFLFLAFLNSQYAPAPPRPEGGSLPMHQKRNILPYALVIFLGLLVALVAYTIPQIADELLAEASVRLKEHPKEAVVLYHKAKRLNSPYFRSASAFFLAGVVNSLREIGREDKTAAQVLFSFTQEEIAQLRALSPSDAWMHLLHVSLYGEMAAIFPERRFLEEQERILEQGWKLSPGRQEFAYWLALVKFELGKTLEAVALLEGMRSPNKSIQRGWDLLLCTFPPSEEQREKMKAALLELEREEQALIENILKTSCESA